MICCGSKRSLQQEQEKRSRRTTTVVVDMIMYKSYGKVRISDLRRNLTDEEGQSRVIVLFRM